MLKIQYNHETMEGVMTTVLEHLQGLDVLGEVTAIARKDDILLRGSLNYALRLYDGYIHAIEYDIHGYDDSIVHVSQLTRYEPGNYEVYGRPDPKTGKFRRDIYAEQIRSELVPVIEALQDVRLVYMPTTDRDGDLVSLNVDEQGPSKGPLVWYGFGGDPIWQYIQDEFITSMLQPPFTILPIDNEFPAVLSIGAYGFMDRIIIPHPLYDTDECKPYIRSEMKFFGDAEVYRESVEKSRLLSDLLERVARTHQDRREIWERMVVDHIETDSTWCILE